MGRTFQEIANEIELTWCGITTNTLRASMYLEALQELDTTDPEAEVNGQRAKDLVFGFLSKAYLFHGAKANKLKCELRDAAGIKFNVHNHKHTI